MFVMCAFTTVIYDVKVFKKLLSLATKRRDRLKLLTERKSLKKSTYSPGDLLAI